jgi:tRNA(Ile)-lysidine synthase
MGASSRALDLLRRCDFPPPGATVALAVSGGADSLGLLVLSSAARLDATAIHVDHGLRDGSQEEAAVVETAAARYGLRFEARAVRVEPGPDLEARARRARYGSLPRGVLTGHTMDDQAETVLLNLMRGAGLDGLAGMRTGDGRGFAGEPDGPGRLGRPLLGLRRADTEELCRSEGLDPVVDSSNFDRRFRRNRVRHEVLPLLCAVAQRDVVPILARQAALLGADADYLETLAAGIDPRDARQLRESPLPLARRAIRMWLRSDEGLCDAEEHPPSAAEVARVLAVASGTAQGCEVEGGRRVRRRSGRLEITGAPAR